MTTTCNYSGLCQHKDFMKGCQSKSGCSHQKDIKNTEMMRTGPDQDGRWYSVKNKEYTNL